MSDLRRHRGRLWLCGTGLLLLTARSARAEVETVTVQLEEARCFS